MTSEFIDCPKCLGYGYILHVEYKNTWYKLICPKCLGEKKVDWVKNALYPNYDNMSEDIFRCITISTILKRDNYIIIFNKRAHIIKDKFFLNSDVRQKLANIVINVPYYIYNPSVFKLCM